MAVELLSTYCDTEDDPMWISSSSWVWISLTLMDVRNGAI